MHLYDSSAKPLRLLISMMLAGCAADGDPPTDAEELTSADLREREYPGKKADRKGHRPPVPCVQLDAGSPLGIDAGAPAPAITDAGLQGSVDAAAVWPPDASRPRGPSTALGAKVGDPCSPVEGDESYWALCEARRGLRCRAPSSEPSDGPSRCACTPGATFERGLCSNDDWPTAPADEEPLGPSTALGAKVGDQCTVGAFAGEHWALCDARRGLTCRVLRSRPGELDVNVVCQCPEEATFVDGVCTARPPAPQAAP